jgi:uncharacterized ferredoxin-like protein
MAIIQEAEARDKSLRQIAELMLIAARTAPKGRGMDHLSMVILEGEEIQKVSDKMMEIGENSGAHYFIRDAKNILSSPVLVIMGTRISSLGLTHCGNCGFANCDEKNKYPDIPCAFNTGDLGIAIGSAVGTAMDHRVDNRIMFTVGQAVFKLGIMDPDVRVIYGIPLTATSKNPFFDRKI